ncbi:TolC family protein [Vibrio sinensis]|uniref:TolC family protein n=1 Tax=Vibrio sinensis TaxID=2302434 RepID=A0A3A6QWX1_9VIBR|nr:TolC family protein [Vibrio sinensis]RJX72979.1 TolC family protein [Vibrio sinensis]
MDIFVMNNPSVLAHSLCAVAVISAPMAMAHNSESPPRIAVSHSITRLIEQAITHDATRKQFAAQSQAVRETGIASATLMDPKVKIGVGGLPTDSFKFDDDPMTNISLGVMQQFERGDTLDLQQKKANQQADSITLQSAARELDIANAMSQLWLELGYQQTAQQILRENQRLLRELENVIQTNYAIGTSEAQDLLQAQLQVSQLDEKLNANQQMQQRIIAQLSEWLGSKWLDNNPSNPKPNLQATNQLDWIKLDGLIDTERDQTQHYRLLAQHPMVKMADIAIATNHTQVEIAEQAYQPQFGVEVMYAYRQANNMRGEPASDLVSAYLTMDIPLFTGNRQDRTHAATQYQLGATQQQKDRLLAQMNANVNRLLVDRSNLTQRLERYSLTLLPQVEARIDAVERGYQNNTAQFNDVISASREALNLQLEQARLVTDLNIVNSNLAALLSAFDYQVTPATYSIHDTQPTN